MLGGHGRTTYLGPASLCTRRKPISYYIQSFRGSPKKLRSIELVFCTGGLIERSRSRFREKPKIRKTSIEILKNSRYRPYFNSFRSNHRTICILSYIHGVKPHRALGGNPMRSFSVLGFRLLCFGFCEISSVKSHLSLVPPACWLLCVAWGASVHIHRRRVCAFDDVPT